MGALWGSCGSWDSGPNMWGLAAVVPLAVAVFLATISWLDDVASEQADGTGNVLEVGSEQYPCPLETLYPLLPEWHSLLMSAYQSRIILAESPAIVPPEECSIQEEPSPKKYIVQDAALGNSAVLSIVNIPACGEPFPPEKFQSPHLPNPNLCPSESVPCRTKLLLLPLPQTIDSNFRRIPHLRGAHIRPAARCLQTRRTTHDA